MKIRFIAVAMGLSLALSAARANDILAITETGENFNDLVVTFNGAPLAGVNITGTADNWTVELPSVRNGSHSPALAYRVDDSGRLRINTRPRLCLPYA